MAQFVYTESSENDAERYFADEITAPVIRIGVFMDFHLRYSFLFLVIAVACANIKPALANQELCVAAPPAVPPGFEQTAVVSFKEMPWGRYTEITIEVLPSKASAMKVAGNQYAVNELAASALYVAQQHPAVTFMIPGFEYGMAGAFSNLRIESGEGISVKRDGRIGAQFADTNTDYTGQVTILEFTESALKGCYSADLYRSHLSDRETRARARDFIGHIEGGFNIDLSTINPAEVDALAKKMLPDVPEGLSEGDQALLQKIQAAGVPPENQAAFLEQLRGMSPEMQDMVLSSVNDSY